MRHNRTALTNKPDPQKISWRKMTATWYVSAPVGAYRGEVHIVGKDHYAYIFHVHQPTVHLSPQRIHSLAGVQLICEFDLRRLAGKPLEQLPTATLAPSALPPDPVPPSDPDKIVWISQSDGRSRSTLLQGAYGQIQRRKHDLHVSIHDASSGRALAETYCFKERTARDWCEYKLWAYPLRGIGQTHGPKTIATDYRFVEALQACSSHLRDLALALLNRVRTRFTGLLHYHKPSGRWVETPDNFWIVRLQEEDRSLRIIIRADPRRLAVPSDIKLTPDRPSYVTFKIQQMSQVDSAFSLIQQASHNRKVDYWEGW